MNSLNFKLYKVKPEIIASFYEIDPEILHDKNRPYLGTIIIINNLEQEFRYFVPFTSPDKHKYRNNKDIRYMHILDKKKKVIGCLLFHKMIPLHINDVDLVNLDYEKEKDIKYYKLLATQITFVIRHKQRIYNKCHKYYNSYKAYAKLPTENNNKLFKMSTNLTLLECMYTKKGA